VWEAPHLRKISIDHCLEELVALLTQKNLQGESFKLLVLKPEIIGNA